MKGNKKLLVIAALLLLISASFTTYAIYRDSVDATGAIKAANWVVKLDKGVTATTPIESADITFTEADLTCTGTRYGKNNTIAPGDSCTVQFTVDATGSEVDVVVEATVDTSNLPSGVTATPTYSGNSGTIQYAQSGMTKTVTLTITWAGSVGDSSTKDGTDKGLAGQELTIPVTVTVRQDAPASA